MFITFLIFKIYILNILLTVFFNLSFISIIIMFFHFRFNKYIWLDIQPFVFYFIYFI